MQETARSSAQKMPATAAADKLIAPFVDEQGRVTRLPVKHKKLQAVLSYLAGKFEPGRSYTEQEVNAICLSWHSFNDYFLIRRSLVDGGWLAREADGSRYWRCDTAPKEVD